jgi:hypothetical protein
MIHQGSNKGKFHDVVGKMLLWAILLIFQTVLFLHKLTEAFPVVLRGRLIRSRGNLARRLECTPGNLSWNLRPTDCSSLMAVRFP